MDHAHLDDLLERLGRLGHRLLLGPGQYQRGQYHRARASVDQRLLLAHVHLERAGRGRGAGAAPHVAGHAPAGILDHAVEERLAHEAPGAHVPRLLLGPDQVRIRRIARQRAGQGGGGEWVELLEAHDGHVVRLRLLAAGGEVVVELAAGEDDAPHAAGVGAGIVQHLLEGAFAPAPAAWRRSADGAAGSWPSAIPRRRRRTSTCCGGRGATPSRSRWW